jgi:hypothetical protein
MKSLYETPEISVMIFSAKDIITTSGGNAVLPDDEVGDDGGGNAILPDDEF